MSNLKGLVRYTGPFLWDILEHGQLKVSKVSELNDPFEFSLYFDEGPDAVLESYRQFVGSPLFADFCARRGLDVSPEAVHQLLSDPQAAHELLQNRRKGLTSMIEDIPRMADQTIRLLSFSSIDHTSEHLMWAHYGDSHRGVRIHFDQNPLSTNATFVEVSYRDFPPFMDARLGEIDVNFVLFLSMLAKPAIWSYEKEWRIFFDASKIKKRFLPGKGGFLEFVPLDTKLISRIDFGISHDQTLRDDLVNQYRDRLSESVRLCQAEKVQGTYDIRYVDI